MSFRVGKGAAEGFRALRDPATHPTFGPLKGKTLGNLRANLVYRFYTGTPFAFSPSEGGKPVWRNGPMFSRTDLNLEKQFGVLSGLSVTLGLEVFNLFNQKDLRSAPPGPGRTIDFSPQYWQAYGIEGLEPLSANALNYGEIYDVNNYWDQPREVKFGVRLKW